MNSPTPPNISYLTMTESKLIGKKAYWTAREISQQPETWLTTAQNISSQQPSITQWLEPILELTGLRIILTGAGTSAYIGNALAPYLTHHHKRKFEAISTTDIVASPSQYLISSSPTLLVSFGRSGDSPESIAAIEIADQLLDNCFHLVITCNPQGKLANYARTSQQAFSLVMPAEALDQSFAMTSSFTSMYISALSIFAPNEQQLSSAINSANIIIKELVHDIKNSALHSDNKYIFLASGSLFGIAQEAALKLLELTAGAVECHHETPLGFRHGPKFLIDGHSSVLFLNSNDDYTSQYERDLFNELNLDNIATKVELLSDKIGKSTKALNGAWLGLSYIVYCQIFAFFKSLSVKATPDNPCPSGEVNRVVQGVRIYPQKQPS